MHTPSSSGADARACYTARMADEERRNMDWQPSASVSVAEGEHSSCVSGPRGTEGMERPVLEGTEYVAPAIGNYEAWCPSQGVTASTVASVSSQRRLPTPPQRDFDSLVQWHANEQAHGRTNSRYISTKLMPVYHSSDYTQVTHKRSHGNLVYMILVLLPRHMLLRICHNLEDDIGQLVLQHHLKTSRLMRALSNHSAMWTRRCNTNGRELVTHMPAG
jgi:hypothetical protein